MANHIIAAGETLFSIAARHGTTVADLAALNGIADPNRIFVGQVLVLPGSPPGAGGTYTVVAGDTLFAIAQRFGTTVAELVRLNAIADPSVIAVGQVLQLPAGAAPAGVASTLALPVALFGSRASDPALQALVPLFDAGADEFGLPRDLVKSLAFVESSWRVDARSASGAVGLCQVMPATAQWINTALLNGAALDPAVADQNVRLACRYLRFLFDQLVEEALSLGGYYQGQGSVQREGLRPDTVLYVQRVQNHRAYFR